MLLTGTELAQREKARADEAHARADEANAQAEALRRKLRELGVDPDALQ